LSHCLILFYFFDSLLQSACPPKRILPVQSQM
jgi:hypothetical protein